MPKAIHILSIEKEEQYSVVILLIQSIFLGIFAGSFDVGAQSLFLKVYDASLIPKAFVISGIVGILITSLYTILQKRMKFSDFAILNLIFVVVATSILRLGFEFTEDKRLVFAIFVMMGPLTIVSFLGFWGTVGRMFTLRQGKRLFGLIDSGQILGIIMSSFAIPVLITIKFDILNSLLICAVSIFLALIMQIIIARNFNLEIKTAEVEQNSKKSNLIDLFRDHYTMLMAVFVVLSVVTAFFVHYSFLTVMKENYPDPDALASFFGAFMGTLMIFTIIFKTFVYSKLMKTYGLKVAVMISPILLGIFTLVASFLGTIFGFTIASASFAFFFLIIALSKLFAKSLKDSIEVPASKILYQSLDVNVRYDVQAKIDGTVNELAAFSSGLMLAGLGLLSFVTIIYYSYFLIIVLIIWTYIAYKLYKSYKASLGTSLKKFQQSKVDESESIPLLDKILPGKNDRDVRHVLQLAPQAWNGYLSKNLNKLLHSNLELRGITLSLIEKLNLSATNKELDELEKSVSGEEKKFISKLLDGFRISPADMEDENLKHLLKSDNPGDRKKALLAIIRKNDPKFYPRVVPMFRDQDLSVRASAIHAAGVLCKKDHVTYLIDLLEDTVFYSFAYNSLCKMDDNILENLEHGFHKTGITEKGMIRITRVISHIGTTLAASYLINKLDHFNRKVFTEAVRGLIKIHPPLSEAESIKVFEALYKWVGITAWNLAALQSIQEFKLDKTLLGAMEEEIADNFDMIFGLLSIAYDAQSIYHIRKNIESGTSEGIGFAIELLDLFVHESVKPYLFPLLDDTGLTEKIRQLQFEYPVDIIEPLDLLLSLINRDYNQIRVYTRICALQALGKLEEYKLSQDIVAQMFNTDPIIREMASVLVHKLDKNIYSSVLSRLSDDSSDAIEFYLKYAGTSEDPGQYRQFELLKNTGIFDEFKNHDLLEIAKRFELQSIKPKKNRIIQESLNRNTILFIFEGELKITGSKPARLKNGKLINLSDKFAEEDNIALDQNSNALILVMKESLLQELIFDNENAFFPLTELIDEQI